jgi:S1-C subfamily serine protease
MPATANIAGKSVGSWAAAVGVAIAYLTIFTTVSAYATRPASSDSAPTLAAFLSIAHFRRLLRLRSQAASEQALKSSLTKYYLASCWSALWRWVLIFIGLGVGAAILTDEPKAAAASIAVMVIGSIFAPDVPYRVRKRYFNEGPSSFGERNLGWIVFLVVVVSMWAVRYGPTLAGFWAAPEKKSVTAETNSAQQVFNAAENSVVVLESFNESGARLSQGSGVIVGSSPSTAEAGLFRLIKGTDILTNFHVIKNANYVVITTRQGTSHLGTVIYFDETQDIAVLRGPFDTPIDEARIAGEVSVGERVFTISNPQGLGWTLSEGIVSRMPSAESALLQFTAPVSTGSSGGGLFNERLDLLGIVTAILKDSQNINFAIYLNPYEKTIAALRQRAAFPFSSVDANDWKAGYFLTDEADRANGKRYASRVALNSSYGDQRADISKRWFKEAQQATSRAEAINAMTRMDQRLEEFFANQESLIRTWRTKFPNDPDAAVANIEMLVRLGEINAASEAAGSALEDFPLNLDVVGEVVDLLHAIDRPDLVADLLAETSEALQSAEDTHRKFSDSWSNEYFEAKETFRKNSAHSQLIHFETQCKAWGSPKKSSDR